MDPLRRSLCEELAASMNDRFAVASVRGHSDGQIVRWVLVASLKPLAAEPPLEIGLTEHGQWVVAAADGSVVDVQAAENYLPLFPLLELPIDEARDQLKTEFTKRGVNEKWLQLFPFHDLVAAGLTIRSKSWASLAFRWVENLGPSETLCAAVDLVRTMGLTQAQRHEAARVLSAWRRRRKS